MATNRMGRPKKYEEEPVTWGMKISRAGREKIKELGKLSNKPASQVVLELVEKALIEMKATHKTTLTRRISAYELRGMPKEERERILREQTEIALLDYEVVPDGFDMVDD